MSDRSLIAFRERWHVRMVEVYGYIAGRCLVRLARHALAIDDQVTIWRAREVTRRGVEVGWDTSSPDNGKAVPHRRYAEGIPS